MDSDRRPKLEYNILIQEKIKDKGITTYKHTDNQIKEILVTHNYFYRLTSYRKNFDKNQHNKYINLDFEALVDMASIDVRLREYLLSMTLDVEHYTKTLLMDLITNDPEEDGYTILEDFKNFRLENVAYYNNSISRFKRNLYLKDMYDKRSADIPIWVFLEIVDFGTLIKFVNFYHHRKTVTSIQQLDRTLKFIKNIRNCCAHNNIYFINIYSEKLKMRKNPTSEITTFSRSIGINLRNVKYYKINDLVALFYLHNRLATQKLKKRRFQDGQQLVERMKINTHLYKSCDSYNKFLPTLSKLIDFLNND
ncbi:Abi family protein [Fundicoccus culcitae]|uniref:Abi family protein n=1 Tax=Fundicoccus culcitae TaxID=2969821 RepID=A0ABY5P9L9_9LACT|nr:Abi family protein [Fundicoccus culcitae]UUX35118.1 Abi family protein [Fundicoccus culcitae]